MAAKVIESSTSVQAAPIELSCFIDQAIEGGTIIQLGELLVRVRKFTGLGGNLEHYTEIMPCLMAYWINAILVLILSCSIILYL